MLLDTLSIFENDKDAKTSLAAKSLLGTLQTKKFVTLLRHLPERLRDAYLISSVGHPNASNFEELSILLRQNVGEILAELEARFGADQSGIMTHEGCCLFLTKLLYLS